MNKLLKAGVLSLALASSLVYAAEDFGDKSYSLIGIEGGYGNFDFDHGVTGSITTTSKSPAEYGFKIGAQSSEYRLFLSARSYTMSDFKNVYSLGAEIQYLLDVSSYMNVFMGVGAGQMNFKYTASSSVADVSDDKTYYSGDLGANFHVADSLDVEVGGRYMYLGYDKTSSTTAVGKIDHMVYGYASLIYRFQMED